MAFVNTPEEGVPKSPLNVTNEPAEPTFIPSAVATPVPNDDSPVPPRLVASCPVHPRLNDVGCSNAVFGVPPKVSVTLVSLFSLMVDL